MGISKFIIIIFIVCVAAQNQQPNNNNNNNNQGTGSNPQVPRVEGIVAQNNGFNNGQQGSGPNGGFGSQQQQNSGNGFNNNGWGQQQDGSNGNGFGGQNNNGNGAQPFGGGNSVVAPGGGNNPGSNNNRASLLGSLEKLLGSLIGNIHQTPGLNQNELFQLFAIIKNQNLTKSQVTSQIEQWVTRQGQDIQKLYNDAKNRVSQEMTNINAEINAKAAALSTQAKSAYDQYKSIISNDGISRREECERLESITTSLDSSIRQELFQAFGSLRMCPKSNNNNNNNGNGFQNQNGNGFGGQQNQGFGNNQMNGQNGFNNGQQGSAVNGGFGSQPQQNSGNGFNNNGWGQQQDGTNGNGFGGQQQNGFNNQQELKYSFISRSILSGVLLNKF